jgi:hypothetical protein
MARGYVAGGQLLEARRLLKRSISSGRALPDLTGTSPVQRLLSEVNEVLAEQIEQMGHNSLASGKLTQDVLDGLQAIGRRIDLHINLGAKELTVNRLLEMVSSRPSFPAREAEEVDRLGGLFGAGWERLRGKPATVLVLAELLYSETEPYEASHPSALATLYADALEALLRNVLNIGAGHLTLGDLAATLPRFRHQVDPSSLSPPQKTVHQTLQSAVWKSHFDFWTTELPALLTSKEFNVINLRNRAHHNGSVTWAELRRLRTLLMGESDRQGMIARIARASPSERLTTPGHTA